MCKCLAKKEITGVISNYQETVIFTFIVQFRQGMKVIYQGFFPTVTLVLQRRKGSERFLILNKNIRTHINIVLLVTNIQRLLTNMSKTLKLKCVQSAKCIQNHLKLNNKMILNNCVQGFVHSNGYSSMIVAESQLKKHQQANK